MPTRTLLLFGGRSAEHEVSILSARSVAKAAPKERIEIIPMGIARDGRFVTPERSAKILDDNDTSDAGDADFSMESWVHTAAIDCVLPLIHGTGGEDGTLQGYLEMLGLPYATTCTPSPPPNFRSSNSFRFTNTTGTTSANASCAPSTMRCACRTS